MRTDRQRPIFLVLAAFALLVTALGAIATPVLAQDDPAYIVIAKHSCPSGFDAYAATLDELRKGCVLAEDLPPATFTVEYGDGTVESVETKGAMIMLADVPVGGTTTLTEVLPAGAGERLVFCTAKEGGAEVMEPTLMPLVNGNTIEIEPVAGQTLSCFWFNVSRAAGIQDEATPDPASGGASVDVVVHGCSPDVDPTSTATQLLDGCTGHPVVQLSAEDSDDYFAADTTSGIAGDNLVQFEDVPATEITLSQLRPQSERTLAVFCADAATAADPATWEQANVANGVGIDRGIAEGDQLTCHWFNDGGDVEGDSSGSTVEIRAWTCVPGTELDSDDEWLYYFDKCETVDTETTFTLTDSAGARPAEQTGKWSTWTGVASSEFTIAGATPDGFGESMVVCSAFEGNRVAVEWLVAENGAISDVFEDEDGQIVSCDWFNIPVAGTQVLPELTVIVHTCPTAEFVTAADCVVNSDGGMVNLMRADGDPALGDWDKEATANTNQQGSRTFEDLEPGDYWVENPDGEWCHVESESLDESGTWINVESGQNPTVMVYACAAPVSRLSAD